MKTIYDLKASFQNLLRPIVELLARHKITANQVTLAACLLSLAIGVCILLFPSAHWPFLLLPLVLLLRMALNAIDGMLATEHHMQSQLGRYLNELGDVFSDVFMYLPFSLVPGISAVWVVLFVILAIISEMAGVIAVQLGKKRRYDGPLGKSDRAFVIAIMSLLMGFNLAAGLWTNIIFLILGLLLIVTIIKRIKNALEDAS